MYYEKEADEKSYYLFRRCEHDGHTAPYFTPPHCHEVSEQLVISEGEAEVALNGERRILCAGEILFLNSYDIHSFVFRECVRYSLVFSKDYSRMLATDEKTLPNYPVCDKSAFSDILSILEHYYSQYGEKIPNALLVEGLVSSVLGIIENSSGKVQRQSASVQAIEVSFIQTSPSSVPK